MTTSTQPDRAHKRYKAIAAVVILIPLILILFYALNILWLHEVFGYVRDRLRAVGLSGHLATGLAALVWLPLFYFIGQAMRPFGQRKRMIGLAGVSLYIAAYSLLAWAAQRNTFFGPGGEPVRYYALTPEGYKFYDEPGVDPTYGMPLKPVTPQIVEAARGKGADLVQYDSLEDVPLPFDPITGESNIWYRGDPEGKITFYSRGGFDPRTGEALLRVDPEVIRRYRESRARLADEAARQSVAASRTRARKEATEREEAFRDRYVRPDAINALDRGRPCLLLGLAGASGERMQSTLADGLRNEGFQVSSRALRPGALSDGIFEKLSSGDARTLERLGLAELRGHLLLGRVSLTSPEPTKTVENLVTVTARVDWIVVPLAGGAPARGSIQSPGAGVSPDEASGNAIARLAELTLRNEAVRANLR